MADDFAPPPATEQQITRSLYDRNAAAPLPAPAKGEFHSFSSAASQVEQRAAELFAETGMSGAASSALAHTFRDIQKGTGLPDGLVA